MHTLLINVGGILMIDHVISKRDRAVRISNDGEGQLRAGDLIDILDPVMVGLERVGRQADQLGVTLSELRFKLSESTKLSGASGSEVVLPLLKD